MEANAYTVKNKSQMNKPFRTATLRKVFDKCSVMNIYFAIFSQYANQKLLRKLNYTVVFSRYYIYTNRLTSKSLLLSQLVSKIATQCKLKKLN